MRGIILWSGISLLALYCTPAAWAADDKILYSQVQEVAPLQNVVRTQSIDIPVEIEGKHYTLQGKLYCPGECERLQGRYPTLVMTHGRDGPHPAPRENEVNSYTAFNSALAKQGYLILFVVRRGYGRSEGPDSEFLDTPEASGLAAAQDVRATVVYARTLEHVDPDKIIVAGQSQGGWVAVAVSTQEMPGVLGAVNLSGAINFRNQTGGITGPGVEGPIERSAAAFGKASKMPMLWIYASNDNHSIYSVSKWHEAYVQAGGKARLVFTPEFNGAGRNGHGVVNQPAYYFTELLTWFRELGFR